MNHTDGADVNENGVKLHAEVSKRSAQLIGTQEKGRQDRWKVRNWEKEGRQTERGGKSWIEC